MKKDDLHLLQEAYGVVNEIRNRLDYGKEPEREPNGESINLHQYVLKNFPEEIKVALAEEFIDSNHEEARILAENLRENWQDIVQSACEEVIEDMFGEDEAAAY